MCKSKLDPRIWPEAMKYTTFIWNRVWQRSLNKNPFELYGGDLEYRGAPMTTCFFPLILIGAKRDDATVEVHSETSPNPFNIPRDL